MARPNIAIWGRPKNVLESSGLQLRRIPAYCIEEDRKCRVVVGELRSSAEVWSEDGYTIASPLPFWRKAVLQVIWGSRLWLTELKPISAASSPLENHRSEFRVNKFGVVEQNGKTGTQIKSWTLEESPAIRTGKTSRESDHRIAKRA